MMTLPLLLLALTTTTAWPLAGTKTLVAKANFTFTNSKSQISGLEEEWFSFESGPPHCNSRHRIDYVGTSGIITVTDPTDETYTTTAFTNISHLKQCTVTGPAPIPDNKCINSIEAIGTQFTFSSVGPCPGAASARRCDAWINKGRSSQQNLGVMTTFFFVSGTNTAVRFLTNTTAGSSESILDFTEWSVNTPVPASAWDVPSDWQPCMKPTPATMPNLAAPHIGVLGSLMSTLALD